MGANVSKSSQKVYTEKSTEIINKVMTNYSTKQSNQQDNIQVMNITVDGKFQCKGDSNLKQIQNSIFSAIMKSSVTDKKDMTNQIYTDLKEAITNQIKQENGGINFGQANVNWSDSDVQTKLHDKIDTVFNTTIDTTFKNDNTNAQIINFHVHDYIVDGDCNMNQDQQVQFLAQMMTESIASSLISNFDKSVMDVKADNTVSQINSGFLYFGGGLFGIIGVVLICYIIYMVVKKKSGGGGGEGGGEMS